MKRLIYFLSILFIITSCNKIDIFSTNEIKGTFTDYDGDCIYAIYENFDSGLITDTIEIKEGSFKANLKLNNSKTPVYLINSEHKAITSLFLKEEEEVILSGSSNPYQTIIEGDSTNILLGGFFNTNFSLLIKNDSIKDIYIDNYNDSIYLSELDLVNRSIVKNAIKFVEENLTSPSSTFIIYEYIASPKYKKLTRELSEKLSPLAKTEVISARIEHFAAIQKLDKGKTLPSSIQLKTQTDSLVYSCQYKNKITILTFWDSSDSASIKKVREVEIFYDTLKQKEKVSVHLVSLDIDKENWLKVIEKEKFKSFKTYVSDGWANRDITDINLRVVPSIFLLNRNGIIIGRELEFDSLNYLIQKTIINNDSLDDLRKKRRKNGK